MRHSIQNNFFQITVNEIGAELCSIKSLQTNQEFLWQADPEIWASHAPNLFPIIGCLKNDAFIHEEKLYPMTKHGFVRNNPDIQLLAKDDNKMSFVLFSNEKTRKLYPFEFEFRIHFLLDSNTIEIKHEIINNGHKELLFSLGGHPAFACPLKKEEKYTDYYLEFEKKEKVNTWNLSEGGLIGEKGKLILDESKILNLHPELFVNDALIFKNIQSKSVSLKSKKSNFQLKVSFSDFPYLGLWAKPNAPYVCIEPWIGIADRADSNQEFSSKELIQHLETGKKFTASYFIEINE
ncbi:aldose 1-epimerase family protein [Ancylomarina longa]|uniref:Aldose 1-epimerase family protein n=1 Tax=Ancylomarina longa TaxID=2487017 RepID=A0A434B047_9BACT|nr:aldose 1-epimerase family protein [Ancylomarina longa]RUT80154.1 aldose 1-epimerase family protein [Ancylomarina longa]